MSTFFSRLDKVFRKTITFDGTSGNGATGTVAIGTVTGAILLTLGGVRCTTDLTSSSGTISLGVAGNTAGLIASTLASDIDSGEFWQDSTPEAGISPAIVNQNVVGNIIATIGVASITAGVLEFVFFWRPFSATGNLA